MTPKHVNRQSDFGAERASADEARLEEGVERLPVASDNGVRRRRQRAAGAAAAALRRLVKQATGADGSAPRRLLDGHAQAPAAHEPVGQRQRALDDADRKSTRLNSSHLGISYAVF